MKANKFDMTELSHVDRTFLSMNKKEREKLRDELLKQCTIQHTGLGDMIIMHHPIMKAESELPPLDLDKMCKCETKPLKKCLTK